MPLPAVIALLALMGSVLAWGFAGRPAKRQHPLPTIALLGGGLVSLPLGLGATAIRHPAAGLLTISTGVCLLALAAHLLRAPAGPPPDDGSDGPGDACDPPPDWDAFDRDRESWARERSAIR